MRPKSKAFELVVQDLARIDEMRKVAMKEAFAVLEEHDPEVADILLVQFGDRRRAACWMCVTHRFLEGRTAYEALAQGDVDVLWDVLASADPNGALSWERG
ncbi:DUF2384 domain-containing protein [Dyella halodurans]|uniref:DUF2384 domain-containing protein n=1 Tax=Dyella halodurans TaxID=1920171 RepID=A0ABV9C325_9GAMM|nr:DUF2384 domain-containing protein [Dyella halodurans]